MKRFKLQFLNELLVTTFILISFTWLRLSQINQTLFFFGDLGRDFYTLQTWQSTGRPPLLGPQTSALAFNQSAIYFYLLYPFYLIFNQSVLSTIFASYLVHMIVFVIGVFFLRRRPQLRKIWLVAWFFLSLHPEMVSQHRYVWNPSFVAVSLLSSFIFWRCYLLDRKRWQLFGWAGGLALATAFSYSVAPVIGAYSLLLLWRYRKDLLPFVTALVLCLVIVNGPTLAFELRHSFVMTKAMIFGEKMRQLELSHTEKLRSLQEFGLAVRHSRVALTLVSLLLTVIASTLVRQRRQNKQADPLLRDVVLLFLATTIITVLLPLALTAHYLFGIIVFGVLIIAALPNRWLITFSLVFACIWLLPSQVSQYFRPTFRSPLATETCVQEICAQLTEPVFVSVQPGYYPAHNHAGLEFRFLLNKAGCVAKDVETEPQSANQMVVFADNSTYEHNQTAYNELTQFGASEEIKTIQCRVPITAHVLKRLPTIH